MASNKPDMVAIMYRYRTEYLGMFLFTSMPLSQRGERASHTGRKCFINIFFLSSEDDRDSRVVIVDYIRVFQTFQVLRYSPRVLLLPVLVN